jgi:pimeloyl-ACP methyl ester carboxylesterase
MLKMKKYLQLGKWVGYVFAGLIVLVFIGLLVFKMSLRNSTMIDTPNGISSLEEITLGGVKQWIFISGTDQNNPVLVFLHGGPGMPILGMASSRDLDAEIIEHFTVVHWDQRGTGKSYDSELPMSAVTVERIVEDCNELIDYLRDRFNQEKVFLVAHSWGTVFGVKTVYKYPEKIHAYVGVAQLIDNAEREELTYNYVLTEAQRTGDEKIQNALEAIGPPPFDSLDELYVKDGYSPRSGLIKDDANAAQLGTLMLSFLTSPEYSFIEGINTIRMVGMDFTIEALWDEWETTNVAEEIQAIEVPIYFIAGRYDWTHPTVTVEQFYENLEDKDGVNLIIFDNSAHFPMIEEEEKFQDVLIDVVLRDSLNN